MNFLYQFRREILKKIVPEFFWPKTIVIDNAIIPIRHTPYSFGVKRVLTKGNYENSERTLIKRVLKKDDIVLEMGGSIGIIAAIVSPIIGKDGRIVSIEASEKLATFSKTWLEPKGNIKIVTGIGFPVQQTPEKYKNLRFIDTGNSLGGSVEFKSELNDESENIYDINRIIQEFNINPNILILDIEGSEIVFLDDNAQIPTQIEHIIIEMHPGMYGIQTEIDIINKLAILGFKNIEEISHVYLLSRLK